eukprot:10258628-Ditylum_brightwellii.AAC.1
MTICEEEEEEEEKENENGDSSRTVGLVFWREVGAKEMEEWIDLNAFMKSKDPLNLLLPPPPSSSLLKEGKGKGRGVKEDVVSSLSALSAMTEMCDHDNFQDDSKGDKPQRSKPLERDLSLVRENSLKWLEKAGEDVAAAVAATDTSTLTKKKNYRHNDNHTKNLSSSLSKSMKCITHHWVKIELLAVKRQHWKKQIGTLLLGGALYQASHKTNSKHSRIHNKCILHVAGGMQNIPAMRLYNKFGFMLSPDG